MSVFGKIVYGLQVAAIGLVVVFLGLTILIAFITLMAQVFKAIDAKKAEKAKETGVPGMQRQLSFLMEETLLTSPEL